MNGLGYARVQVAAVPFHAGVELTEHQVAELVDGREVAGVRLPCLAGGGYALARVGDCGPDLIGECRCVIAHGSILPVIVYLSR